MHVSVQQQAREEAASSVRESYVGRVIHRHYNNFLPIRDMISIIEGRVVFGSAQFYEVYFGNLESGGDDVFAPFREGCRGRNATPEIHIEDELHCTLLDTVGDSVFRESSG